MTTNLIFRPRYPGKAAFTIARAPESRMDVLNDSRMLMPCHLELCVTIVSAVWTDLERTVRRFHFHKDSANEPCAIVVSWISIRSWRIPVDMSTVFAFT